MRGYLTTEYPALAHGKVRFAGEAVAAVVAESRYVAEDATEVVVVDWEPLEAVHDPELALRAGTPLVHEAVGSNALVERTFAQGDADGALAAAPLVVGDRFRFNRHAGVTIENRACLAEWEAGTQSLTLWSSTQVPGLVRDLLADLLGVSAHRVRVVAPDVGGGFGMKSALYPEEIVVSALARRLGRPVRWIGDRREDLLTSTQAWDEIVDAELGVDVDGTIRGLRARVTADIGAYSIYPWTASIEVIQVISFLPGPYRVPHYRGELARGRHQQGADGPLPGCGASRLNVRDRVAPRTCRTPARARSRGDAPTQHDQSGGVSLSVALRCRLGHRHLPGDIGECLHEGRLRRAPRGAGSSTRCRAVLWYRRRFLRRADRRRLGHPSVAGVDHRDGHRRRHPARGSRAGRSPRLSGSRVMVKATRRAWPRSWPTSWA